MPKSYSNVRHIYPPKTSLFRKTVFWVINEGTSLHKLLKSTLCWGNTGGTTHYNRVKVRQLAVQSTLVKEPKDLTDCNLFHHAARQGHHSEPQFIYLQIGV